MTVKFGTGLVHIELNWQDFKQICQSKTLEIQHVINSQYNLYEIFALDNSIVYSTNIFIGTIPSVCDCDQQTNDLYKNDFESNFIIKSNKRLSPSIQGTETALKVTTVGREGEEIVWATHNFADKTSWYSNSTQYTNIKLLSGDNGYTFYASGTLKNESWIDLYNGKVLHENNIRQAFNGKYDVSIFVDGIKKEMKTCVNKYCTTCPGDYTVDFVSGTVKFENQITSSEVYGNFSIPVDSWWTLRPMPGTILDVEGAEMQFSEDIILTDNIIMQILGYVEVFAPQYWQQNGGPFPTNYKIVLGEYEYKSLAEFVDETDGSFPVVPAIGGENRGIKSAMYGLPFKYNTIRTLYPEYGLEIRVGLKHNHPYDGFRATATFYCIQRYK